MSEYHSTMKHHDLTISEAADLIRAGDLRPVDYTRALLDKAVIESDLNAFIHHDPEQVLAAVNTAERTKPESNHGPLHGIPLIIKDNIDTRDMPTTAGTPGLQHHRPHRHAPVVQRLCDAGAIVFGKGNLHELAAGVTTNNAAFGPSRNPYDSSCIPGGSSGGVASAVAARIVPGGIGTDTGGSVRIPAALCGLVGFRPTTNRWPRAGIVPVSRTRDTAGPIVRSVADAILLDSVITGEGTERPSDPSSPIRLGIPRAHFWETLDPETSRVMEEALGRLDDAGIMLVEADIPEVERLDHDAGFPIAFHETVTDLEAYLEHHGLAVDFPGLVKQCAGPDVRTFLESSYGDAAISIERYRHALEVLRPRLQKIYRDHFAQHGLSAIVFPTTPLPAAPIGQDETVQLLGREVSTFLTYIRNTSPASVAGLPAISLPAGLTETGLPVGLELDGPAGSDTRLLAIATVIERALTPMPPPGG